MAKAFEEVTFELLVKLEYLKFFSKSIPDRRSSRFMMGASVAGAEWRLDLAGHCRGFMFILPEMVHFRRVTHLTCFTGAILRMDYRWRVT